MSDFVSVDVTTVEATVSVEAVAMDVLVDSPQSVVIDVAPVGERGQRGPQGPAGTASITREAGAVLNGHRVVAYGADGRIVHASADNLDHFFALAGVISSAAVVGDLVTVNVFDALEFSGWSWTPGPVYLGIDGQLTQDLPPTALFTQVIGRGDGVRLFVSIQPPVME